MEDVLKLAFLKEWERAIVAKLVLKCGDREYLDKLAIDVSDAFNRLSKRIKGYLKDKKNSKHKKTLEKFLTDLRAILNDSISADRAIEMLAIHSVAKPLFEALFEVRGDFSKENPVSKSMDGVLKLFGHQTLAETKDLQKSYDSIKKRVANIDTLEGRQNLIKDLYQMVFKKAFPKIQEQLGIVYTPVEVVDFTLKSSHELLKKEFGEGEGFSSRNVKALDPFSGTGTFLTRLIENKELIESSALKWKYKNEIFASEMILLAYYITTINVESSYHFRRNKGRKRNDYEPFTGAIFTDTFQSTEGNDEDQQHFDFFKETDRKRSRLKKEKIRVIVGNPPYSVGQKNEDDNSKNLKYENLDKKIRETYAEDSSAVNKNSLYDSYIRALKWASEKIKDNPHGGIVSFVTNASFIDNSSADGLRYHLAKDFTSLYIFNLRGDALCKGDKRRREGGGIFGEGSKCPIAISFLVKNPNKKGCKIHYYDIGDYLKQEQKLLKIRNFGHIFGIKDWEEIKPDKNNDWVNQRNEGYQKYLLMGCKVSCRENIFNTYSMGVKTHRDTWVYNFDREELKKNVKRTISFYNIEVERFKQKGASKGIDKFVNYDSTKISWSGGMKSNLKRERVFKYDDKCFRFSMYRPFCKGGCIIQRTER